MTGRRLRMDRRGMTLVEIMAGFAILAIVVAVSLSIMLFASRVLSGGSARGERVIRLRASGGVRYTVPAAIDPQRMAEELVVRFRVADVYQNAAVLVTADSGEVLQRKKRMILAPGEMEEVKLKKADLLSRPGLGELTISLEVTA